MHALIKRKGKSHKLRLLGPCNDAQSNMSVPEENRVKTGKPDDDRIQVGVWLYGGTAVWQQPGAGFVKVSIPLKGACCEAVIVIESRG